MAAHSDDERDEKRHGAAHDGTGHDGTARDDTGHDDVEQLNVLDARNHLSRLVSAAQQGTDTVIARRGKPVARITAVDSGARHTASGVVAWLEAHPLPAVAVRSRDDLDEQVRTEREGWE